MITTKKSLQPGQIVMKAYPDDVKKIAFYIEAQKVTINWGDGNFFPSSLFDTDSERLFSHIYKENYKKLQTITINTVKMSMFSTRCLFDAIPVELYFGDCQELMTIHCGFQLLKVLEIQKAPALSTIVSANIRYVKPSISATTIDDELSQPDISVRCDTYFRQYHSVAKIRAQRKRMFL